jgi:hypothetical protein
MRFKPLLITILFASACAALPFPGMSGNGQAHKTETSSSSTTEEMNVNGRPVSVAQADDDEDEHLPKKKKKQSGDGDIGKTCHKNHECAADACFVGNGDLGYCTKMCNSWSECPSHWECKRAGNAPQKICMQDD